MRAALSCLVALTLFVAAPTRAEAVTFTELVVSDAPPDAPNIMSFFLAPSGTTTFSSTLPSFFFGIDGGTSNWTYWVSPDGKFAQLQSQTPFGALTENVAPLLGFIQPQPGPAQTAFTLDWQEVQYDWATNTLVGGTFHSTVFNGGSAPPAGGPNTLLGPVPEPATFAIFGFGALLAASAAKRSRAKRLAA